MTLNADGSNNDVIIQSNGSTKVTVDGATGNVGVGQTTPASNNSSPRVLHIGSSGDSKASIVLEENGSTGSNTWEILSDDELQIRRGSSQKMYFKTDGLAVFNNGVALGGTGAANTLSDCEIGTWTGTINGHSSAPNSAQTATGTYTKVGRLVTFMISFGNKNTTGASGNLRVTGLPFTVGVHSFGSYISYGIANYTSNSVNTAAYMIAGTTRMDFQDNISSGAWGSTQIVAGSAKYLDVSGTFQV